jgi:hypothetical protein
LAFANPSPHGKVGAHGKEHAARQPSARTAKAFAVQMVDASTLPSEALSAFFAVRPRMATPLPDVQDLLPCDCSHGKDQFSRSVIRILPKSQVVGFKTKLKYQIKIHAFLFTKKDTQEKYTVVILDYTIKISNAHLPINVRIKERMKDKDSCSHIQDHS